MFSPGDLTVQNRVKSTPGCTVSMDKISKIPHRQATHLWLPAAGSPITNEADLLLTTLNAGQGSSSLSLGSRLDLDVFEIHLGGDLHAHA